ncbi:copper chaperone PCu(A)C [Nocardioides ferulae]|uniref:copper chaperone PCu(A)C n=1 Tax=Nocardioides ferulae TaxID=2340821 RepID=UPI000EADCDEA|nr:copper chaperone PCu(A)C [Nocardioides ferulae]
MSIDHTHHSHPPAAGPVRARGTGRRVRRAARLLPALALALTLAACGDDDGDATPETTAAETGGIVVQDAWVRATEGSEDPSMTGAFMVLENDGEDDVDLVGAASPVSGMVELHEMAMVDGDMVMQQVDGGITITAGRGKVLEPGGYHVMLMGLTDPLAPGDEVELTLEFSDGSEQTLTAPVKEFTEEEGHYHEPGTEEHGHDDSSEESMSDSGHGDS